MGFDSYLAVLPSRTAGDLAAIDERYDIAISTACGQLKDILVEDLQAARRCVQYLRQNKCGIATFRSLEDQRKYARDVQRKVQVPDGRGRLGKVVGLVDNHAWCGCGGWF